MVNQTLVLRIMFCGKSPALRVDAKYWKQLKKSLKHRNSSDSRKIKS